MECMGHGEDERERESDDGTGAASGFGECGWGDGMRMGYDGRRNGG